MERMLDLLHMLKAKGPTKIHEIYDRPALVSAYEHKLITITGTGNNRIARLTKKGQACLLQ